MTKLVLIDGNAILHRAYHALPSLTTRKGEPINAVYGLVSMLLKVIQDLKPTHIAVCFDRKEPTFRHEEFKDYQIQRPPTEENLISQFQKARDVLSAMNILTFEMAGFEADDLIGTIAKQSVQNQKSKTKNQNEKSKFKIDEVVIVTGDRDILQLVNDTVKVYLPVKGLSEGKIFGSDEVVEKMGVAPSQIPDYKGLVGDQSDNYKGVNGIGPKTAIKLIEEYGGFEEIYKNLSSVQKPIRERLEADKNNGETSFRLAKIVKDVPVEIDFEKMNKWRLDSNEVLDIFADYGFRTLSKRVKEVAKSIVSENQMKLL